MIIEPIHIITKTSENSGPPSPTCKESDDPWSTLKLYFWVSLNYEYNFTI